MLHYSRQRSSEKTEGWRDSRELSDCSPCFLLLRSIDDLLAPICASSWSCDCARGENEPLIRLVFFPLKRERPDEESYSDMVGEKGEASFDEVDVAVLLRDRRVNTECRFPDAEIMSS